MYKAVLWISIIVIGLVLSFTVSVGELSATTPTPAPSKTPMPDETPETTQVNPENDLAQLSFMEPLTQSDLSVLTGNVQRPNGAAWFGDQIYAACNGDWTLYQLNDRSGSTETYIYGVRNAHTMYVEDDNAGGVNLWIPDFDTNTFLLVNRAVSPQPIASDLQGPWGVAYLDEQGFLVTNLAGNNIMFIGRDGQSRILVDELRSPTGIAVDSSYVYVANNGSSRRSIEWIEKGSLLEGSNAVTQPLVSGLQNTTGIVLGSDGYLYFTYALGTRGVVGRVNPETCLDGGCSNDQVEIVLYTDLLAPLAGLTISPDMRLFVHTIFRPEIYWVQLG